MNQREGAGSEDASKDTVLEGSAASLAPAETLAAPGSDETVPPAAPGVAAAEEAVAAEWAKGDVILDLYEVAGLLGEGGMGKVYRVRHRGWDLDLAVKSPRAGYFQTEEQKQNFVRECETWIDLGLHPHTVSCYYVRTLGGIPRVFAEYVEGGNLADWIRNGKLYEGGPERALERILDVAIQFAWGLGYAHERGLIHQDVKPANVMLTPEGVAKVTDFGLAQARPVQQIEVPDGKGGTVLVRGRGMTPAYCSPEQAGGAELSRKTDIWSWGVSVLEMFIGERTWERGQAASLVLESYRDTEQGESRIPRMPQQLVDLLRRCFEHEPGARPKDMPAVVEQLRVCYREVVGEEYAREEPKPAELLADALNNRAVSLLDLGRREEAEKLFDEALKSDPHHLEVTYNRGLVRWRSARLTDDALVAQLEELRTTHEADWRDEYYLGLVHMERGDAESAVTILEGALRQAPQEEEIQGALEIARSSQGEWRSSVRTFEGHTEGVNSVAISLDGRWGLSGSGSFYTKSEDREHNVRLWELATGQCVRTFRGHPDQVLSVCISPDGRRGLSGSFDRTMRLWELATGECVRTFKGHGGQVNSVSISPDGRWGLSGSRDNTLRMWELATGQCVRTFEGHTQAVSAVSISPDGGWGLSGSYDTTLRMWELATGQCVRTFEGHTNLVHSVSISPDGRWGLSGSADKTLRLWELAAGQCVRTFKGHTGEVDSVTFSPDGRWGLSGSHDMTLRLWELGTGRCVRTFKGHTIGVKSVAFGPDGRWGLSGSYDKTLRRWELNCLDSPASFAIARPRSSAETISAEAEVRRALESAKSALAQGDAARAAAEVSRGRSVPGYERHGELLELWRKARLRGKLRGFSGGWLQRSLEGHKHRAHSASISPDGFWGLSRSSYLKEKPLLWELATGRCVRTFEGNEEGGVICVAFSRDGRQVLLGGDKTLRLWDINTGDCVLMLEGHTKLIVHVAISADGRWALSGSDDCTLQLWELATGQCVRTFEGHANRVTSVSISPDGRWGLSGSWDKTLRLWELATGRCVRTFEGHTLYVHSVSISPDGRWGLSGSWDKTLRLWELATGHCVRTFVGHTGDVITVSFLADGRWGLSGSSDKTLRLWELATGRCLRTFEGHTDAVNSVSVSLDGCWALSGGNDNTLRLWQFDWECEFPPPADWNKGARPYLEMFLTLHTAPRVLPRRRKVNPSWTERELQRLLADLQYYGYGWLRPEGVQRRLEKLARTWKGPRAQAGRIHVLVRQALRVLGIGGQ